MMMFEFMVGTLRDAVGVVLEQRKDRKLNVIHYAIMTLDDT